MRTPTPSPGPSTGQHGSDGTDGVDDWLGDALDGAERRRRRARVLFVILAVCVGTATVTALVWVYLPDSPLGSSAGPPHGDASRPSRSAVPRSGPTTRPSRAAPVIPRRGTGRFLRASGASHKVGRGTLMRYTVEVEDGIGQHASSFARSVDAILSDRRGWTAGGRWAFQRVTSGPRDFVVRLAAPKTVDTLCAKYGLDTDGEVNCAGGEDVVINLKRWLLLTPYYKGRADLYHALAVNHEVGHRLGFNHVTCPRDGGLAPVMMQQIFGMKGCRINGWPYDSRRRFVTGPPSP
ncbi:DUF3152 domain-containing protein [Thermomonospora umbrina]|uniref:Uncharacterized protein DUF3152 n=1 Tax=Thermomonospora umbrina TaxID=111806 RepID=A0A3D9SYQ8_9ACTN|nr:DUF3152 domain-containing protein [Thermomonospora umbrina]REE98115.1 uncharacterized protein DUF3152 [Thermomonospora umbrina]